MHTKSKNLQTLKKQGFNVSDFVVCKIGDNFEEKIKNLDKNKTYAVRSDMGVEDSENSSFAGQFKTFIDVKFDDIKEKINEVIADAKNKNLQENEISVIVQEYIKLDYSGICFTRNPKGSYEMIIEYHKGIGEEIVSGKIKPKTIKMYHWENKNSKNLQKIKNLCGQNEGLQFIENIKKIEKTFEFPQDIEWGIAKGKVYFLQSRNITTILKTKWEEIKYIDKFVKKEKNNILSFGLKVEMPEMQSGYIKDFSFFYEKTEISEILPKVTKFSYDLLLKVYEKNGPVYNFYKENGLKIETKNFLKIIGDELFVDKQIELQNFFPSFTLFKEKYKRKIIWNKNIFRTFYNIFRLNFIKINKNKILKKIENQIFLLLTEGFNPLKKMDTLNKELIENFLKNYKLIFEINFHTQKEFAKIEIIKEKFGINLLDYLDTKLVKKDELKNIKDKLKQIDFSKIVGNSFDIVDNSEFKTNIFDKKIKDIQENFEKLANWKQNFIKNKIEDLQFFSDLREIGRILTVLNINILRKNNVGAVPCVCPDKDFNFENKISDTFVEEENKKINILSNFKAEGKLVNLEYLQKKYKKDEKYILFTKSLNPNLVEYFDKIEGIISENGGALSHLSIMCREYKKMLLVLDLEKEKIKIGDEINFDGEKLKIM